MARQRLWFEVVRGAPIVVGEPRYVDEDYGFDFVMNSAERDRLEDTRTSFVTGTLQLEVAISNSRCLYVWGYCPMGGWSRTALRAPVWQRGCLLAHCEKPLIRAVSIGIEDMIPPIPWFDPESGWFCMGEKGCVSDVDAVEFATDTVAVVTGGRLVALWIKPANWREIGPKFLRAPGSIRRKD